MNFFKSIILDDSEPENSDGSEPYSPKNPSQKPQQAGDTVDNGDDSTKPNQSEGISGWRFGGLINTISTRSESVLETYRRDLQEFGSGLKKESDLFREVASRAVKELPASIEVGTSAIDGVLKSTAEIISQGKDVLFVTSDHESDASESQSSRVYSRFESQLVAIQCDVHTYCDDPEDLDEYRKWKSGFVLDDRKGEIEKLVGGNGAVEGMYKRVVPNEVNHDTFWCRYFFRVYKLKQQEDTRAKLVRRSLSVDDEEELSWDVDDDDEEEEFKKKLEQNVMENKGSGNKDFPQIENREGSNKESTTVGSVIVDEENVLERSGENVMDERVVPEAKSDEKVVDNVMENKDSGSKYFQQIENKESSNEESKNGNVLEATDEKVVDNGKSCKDNDVSVVSTQPSLPEEEEDLGWDDVEDLGSHDEKKASQSGSPKIADVKKRLSAAEEDEDLSWDIEYDDEPLKA